MISQEQYVSLSQLLVTLEAGKRPKGGVNNYVEGVPSLGAEHLNYNNTYNFESMKYVPTYFANRQIRGRIHINDILIVKDGATTGKACFVDNTFPFQNALVNEHVFICRPSIHINSKFLFYFLWGPQGQSQIRSNLRGSAQGGITKNFIHNVLVPLPERKIQDHIAMQLDYFFNAGRSCEAKLNKIIIALERFKQNTYDQYFCPYLNKTLTEDIKQILLGDLIIEGPTNGISPRSVNYKTGVQSLSLSAITQGFLCLDNRNIKNVNILRPPDDSRLWLKQGDILVQRANTIDYVGISAVVPKDIPFIYPDLMMKIKPNPKIIMSEYLHFSLLSSETRQYFRNNATGTSGNMPKINHQVLISTPMLLRTLTKQKQIIEAINISLSFYHSTQHSITCIKKKILQLYQKKLNDIFNIDSGDPSYIRNILCAIEAEKKDIMTLHNHKEVSIMKKKIPLAISSIANSIKKPISTKELLLLANYSPDAQTEELERFFLDLRDCMKKKILNKKRIGFVDMWEQGGIK